MQSHCRKGLASARVLKLLSLTPVDPAQELNVFKSSIFVLTKSRLFEKYNYVVISELLKLQKQCCLNSLCNVRCA